MEQRLDSSPSFICILLDNARKKYPVQTGADLLFLSNAVFTDAGRFVRRGDFHFRAACRSGAPPSPLGPRDQLHRQGHQGPPGLWLRLWEGGPPQVCGHQDRTVGKCLSARGRANRRGRFTHIRVFVSRSRRSRSSSTCVTFSRSSTTLSSGRRWRRRPRRTNSASRPSIR